MTLMLWWFIVLSPALSVAVFGVRALRLRDCQSESDFRDVDHFLGWITTGVVVLAVATLARNYYFSPIKQALMCFLPILAFYFTQGLFFVLIQRTRHEISTLLSVRFVVITMGSAFGIGCYLIIASVVSDSFSVFPTTRLFINLYVVSLIGLIWTARILRFAIKPQRLAPCELSLRVAEIAAAHEVKNRQVHILQSAFVSSNALAFSASGIGLGQDLVQKLNKREVDAIIEHEIAHCADENLWTIRQAIKAASIIAFGLLAFLAEKQITNLENPLWIRDIHWMLLFLLPPLASAWYSRCSERRANRTIGVTDPTAVISGFFKLHLINNLPSERPWWSRILSTHEYYQDELKHFTDKSTLSAADIERIRQQAEAELASGAGEHYELVYYQEEKKDGLVKRPDTRKTTLLLLFGAIAAVAFVCYCALNCSDPGSELALWLPPVSIIGGSFILIAAILLTGKIGAKRMRKNAISALADKYGLEPSKDALLVDVLTMANLDKKIWQAGFLTEREKEIRLLTETGEVSIDLEGKVSATKWVNKAGSAFESYGIAIWYQSEGVAQWVLLRNLGKPERGLPRGSKQLLQHFEKMVENCGGHLADPDDLPTNKRPKLIWSWRIPVAILSTVGVGAAAFCGLRVSEKMDADGCLWITFFLVSIVWSGMWSWARAASKKKPKPADENE